MSFFKKLKDRMFKSSSKIDEGLEAIVGKGEDEEAAVDQTEHEPEPLPEVEPEPLPEIEPEPEPEIEPEAEPEIPFEPDYEPEPSPVEIPTMVAPVLPVADPAPTKEKPGFFGRLVGRTAPAAPRRTLDDEMLEQLEELLITADMGVDTALRVTANMAEGRLGKKLSVDEIKGLLAAEVTRIMEPVARPLPLYPSKPQVVLVVGVNGSGKTTTIAKLANYHKAKGDRVLLAAGDTFRAAAIDQIKIWGERAGAPVMARTTPT